MCLIFRFQKQSYTAFVPENNAGMEVLKVTALDTDLDAKLKYSIIEPIMATTKAGFPIEAFDYSLTFSIDADDGTIVLLRKLENSGIYSVTLTVRVEDLNAIVDGPEQIDKRDVTLYIQSHKESGPVFLNEGWNQMEKLIHLKIDEELDVGTYYS